jgi:4-hydroxy-2-oxoheptanedioate aldolase
MTGARRPTVAGRDAAGRKLLGIGTRGRGSESTAAPVWGVSIEEYMTRCDPWPLNPDGELMLGVKLESPEGIANCEAIIRVPGLAFAEIGPGDLSLSLGYRTIPREPFPAEMQAARDRVLAACRENGVAFLQSCTADNIITRIDEGVRVVAGHSEQAATKGRAYQNRAMPV